MIINDDRSQKCISIERLGVTQAAWNVLTSADTE